MFYYIDPFWSAYWDLIDRMYEARRKELLSLIIEDDCPF